MRQLEGGYLSNAAVDRSKERLQRLPFIEKVETKTTPVPGSPDLVDVDFEIKEGLPGQFTAGIGYSESQSLILNGGFTHTNFMGTGNRVALDINSGRYQKSFQFSHTDPYTTIDGVSRTLSLGYRDITQFTSAASDFSTKTISAGLDYAYPFTEYQSVRAGVGFQRADLFAPYGTAESLAWVQSNGKPYTTTYVDGNGDSALFYGTGVQHLRAEPGLGLRLAQPRHLCGSRRASPAERFLRHAGQRCRVLDCPARHAEIPADLGRLHADAEWRGELRPGARGHDFLSAVPPVFRRWPGIDPRLSREPAGTRRTVRATPTAAT